MNHGETSNVWENISPMDLSLAIDIGGTKFAVGLVSRSGEIIDRTRVPVHSSLTGDDLWDDLAEAVEQQLTAARDRHHAHVVSVGVGSAGPITANCESVSPLNIHQWREFPLRERLRQFTALPVFGEGDGKALALAEGWLGAARGVDNFLAMVV